MPLTLEKAVRGKKYLIREIRQSGPALRILDLGLVPDTEIELVRVAPFGDPGQYKVRGFYLSLRKEEARNILVEAAE
ncbi:MAG: FeoA family protein [Bacillota bacterium]